MSITLDNPKEEFPANPSSTNTFQKFFGVSEERENTPILVPDTSAADVFWKINCNRMRYVFRQTVAVRFTDPDSYSDSDRKPPIYFSSMTSIAKNISHVDLPSAMGTRSTYTARTMTAATGKWNIVNHTLNRIAPGAWEVSMDLIAFSDYIWDSSSFSKTKIKAASSLGASPTL